MATKYILTAPVAFPSAKLIREKLLLFTRNDILVTSDESRVRNKANILFSYGLPSEYSRLNTSGFMHLCSNKNLCSSFLNEHGFTSPVFKRGTPTRQDYPLLIRTTLTGHGGKGIIICHNERQFNTSWNTSYWWTKFINTTSEFRVHVFDGAILKLFKKVRQEELEDNDYPIRNLDNGYHFSLRNREDFPEIVSLVSNLSPILEGGTFYGLDIGRIKNQRDYIVFEINTACGLNEETALLYAERIAEKIVL